MTVEEKLELALDLLDRAANDMEDRSPDSTWLRDFFVLTGDHMILTDEGWESGEVKQDYLDTWQKDHPSWSNPILDEVNAPC